MAGAVGGPTQEQIQTASSVTAKSVSPAAHAITDLDLFCPREGGAAERFPLKDLFVELSLFENLYSGVLRGTLDLRDSKIFELDFKAFSKALIFESNPFA